MPNQKNKQYENIKKITIKNRNKLESGYTQIPNYIILDNRLTGNDFKLLCFYISVSINKDYSFYSQRTIEKILKISSKTIRTSIKKLELLNYITVKKRFSQSDIIIINKYKPLKVDNFRRGKNYRNGAGKITEMAREKLPPNNINNNNINIISDLNLKNKNTYTEQDEIEIEKIRTMLYNNQGV